MNKNIAFLLLLVILTGCSQKPSEENPPAWEELPNQHSWNDYKATYSLDKNYQVTIYEDKYAIPYISSDSDEAAFYALGYMHARDNLEQVYKGILVGQGRLSESFGEQYLSQDKLIRPFMIKERTIAYQDETPIETWKILKAYADGINAYVEQNKSSVPSYAKEILLDEYDIAAYSNWLGIVKAWSLFASDLQVGIKKDKGELDLSNAWTISSKKSAEGNVIFAADPHVPFISDNGMFPRIYQATLESPNYHVTGASIAGSPIFSGANNEYIAWGGTNNDPDDYDAYVETIKNGEYQYDGKWYKIRKETFVFKVNGKKDETVEYDYTHHGPLLFTTNENKRLAIKLAGIDVIHSIAHSALKRARSESIEEVKEELRTLQLRAGNEILASVDGDIYYAYGTLLPIRDPSYEWKKPVPGDTSKTEWKGYYSFDRLPQIMNPLSGWLATTNNAPAFVTVPYFTLDSNLPDYSGATAGKQGLRGQRITELLGSKEKHTLENMKTYVMDTYIPMAPYVVPGLVDALAAYNGYDSDVLDAITIIEQWDYYASKDSEGMSLFWYWYKQYNEGGTPIIPEKIVDFDSTQKEEVVDAFVKTVDYFTQTYGTIHKPWGEIHRLDIDKSIQLSGGDRKFAGEGLTALRLTNTNSFNKDQGIGYVTEGSSYLRVVNLKNGAIEVFTASPFGQSSDPNSSHYADLSRLYGEDQLYKLSFYKEDILKNKVSESTLSYAPLR